jgi:DNA-binding response OmpR family regulator
MSSYDQPDRPVILLVEEDSRQRKDIMGYLSEDEFRVFQAGDTDGALALLEARTTCEAS